MQSFDDLSSVSIAELQATQNWQSQYRLITQWGKLIHHKPWLRVDEYLLRGCETPAWLALRIENKKYRFVFDSDSRVINGLAALLLAHWDNKTPAEVPATNMHNLLGELGLEKHLTPSRNNGLAAIMRRIEELLDASE